MAKFDKEIYDKEKIDSNKFKSEIKSDIKTLKEKEYQSKLDQINKLGRIISKVSSREEYEAALKLLNEAEKITNELNINVYPELQIGHLNTKTSLASLRKLLESKADKYAEVIVPLELIEKSIHVDYTELFANISKVLTITLQRMDDAIDKNNYANDISRIEQSIRKSNGKFTAEQQEFLDNMLSNAQESLNEMNMSRII